MLTIAMMATVLHVMMGFAVGVNVQQWRAEKKYAACVYHEKKVMLKELKHEAEVQQKEMCEEEE